MSRLTAHSHAVHAPFMVFQLVATLELGAVEKESVYIYIYIYLFMPYINPTIS